MNKIFALEGVLNTYSDTSQTIYTTDLVEDAYQYAKDLKKRNFRVFDDANITLIKMMGLSEYDKYRAEIIGEVMTDLTKFGTSSDDESEIIGKVVQQMGLEFGNKPKMDNSLKNTNVNTKTPKTPSKK